MTALLELIDFGLSYNSNLIVKKVSMKIKAGQIVVLLGRNGSGKTTILRGIAGELIPKEGKVLFFGTDITGWEPRTLIKKGLSYLPQGKEFFPDLTVEDNLKVALLPHDLNKGEVIKRREKTLACFPLLENVLKKPAHYISGGYQQILALAMSLSQEPKCLLLDEPSHGLSTSNLDVVRCTLKDFISASRGILLVEQKPKFALKIADWAYYIENGGITSQGPPKELMNNIKFIKSFIGKEETNEEKT